jgi:hypothetical protein
MIVRPGSGVVHLITQPDHAALARRIMEHCVPLAGEPRRDEILLAVGEHDNGWRELDDRPIRGADGRVVDFISAPADAKQGVWPRGVDRLRRNPLAAALVAQHAVTVYDRFRPEPDWAAFFRDMEALRDRLLPQTGLSREELLHAYAYVRLGDLISLLFCTAAIEPQGYGEWFVDREAVDRVTVSPFPFDTPEVRVEVTARELPDRAFASDADLLAAFESAARVTLTGTIAAKRA